MEREYVEFENQFYETFFRYEPERTEAIYYSYFPEKPAISVCQLHMHGGCPICFQCYATGGIANHVYEYDDRRSCRLMVYNREHGREPSGGTAEAHYAPDDEVDRIEYFDGRPKPIPTQKRLAYKRKVR